MSLNSFCGEQSLFYHLLYMFQALILSISIFCCCYSALLPKESSASVARPLAYCAVKDAIRLKNSPSELKRKFLNTNGPLDLDTHPLILFPCRTQ